MMIESAFSLLSPRIQEVLVRKMNWSHLRPIQTAAIRALLEGRTDLILSAKTASGKTEAAFLPILSHIERNPGQSIQALYVSPLKALINDQFRRLDELCQLSEIPVHRWHGDVSAAQKRVLERSPRGVLLITPESLESLFINRSNALARLFSGLRFVVLDELHAFVGRERGTHLRSLLYRLERYVVDKPYRIVGLSATLGGQKASYSSWLRPGASDSVEIIEDQDERKAVHYKIYGYTLAESPSREGAPELHGYTADGDFGADEKCEIVDDILSSFGGRTNLIFANRKSDVELYADRLNSACHRLGRPAEFLVHHGSLGKDVREQTEGMMRGRWPFTTICSSTLELGIDIGNVAVVGQIGAPWSVKSLVQRLGRSGRRDGEPQTMRVYVTEVGTGKDPSLIDRLHLPLLRAIALTELMIGKPMWLEPPVIDELDFSTLVQQILSVVAETGGICADELFDRLVVNGAFGRVERNAFVALLRCIGARDLIEQAPDGSLILGLVGERIVHSFDFYSAFVAPAEYNVTCESRVIGSLAATAVPGVGDHILLAARRWVVEAIDEGRQEVIVIPAGGGKAPIFVGGEIDVHSAVRHKMRDILLSDHAVGYLNATAGRWLEGARSTASALELDRHRVFELSERRCLWIPWVGTRSQRTLMLMGRLRGLGSQSHDLAIEFDAPKRVVIEAFERVVADPPNENELAAATPVKRLRKFDQYLDNELLDKALADGSFDIKEAVEAAAGLLM